MDTSSTINGYPAFVHWDTPNPLYNCPLYPAAIKCCTASAARLPERQYTTILQYSHPCKASGVEIWLDVLYEAKLSTNVEPLICPVVYSLSVRTSTITSNHFVEVSSIIILNMVAFKVVTVVGDSCCADTTHVEVDDDDDDDDGNTIITVNANDITTITMISILYFNIVSRFLANQLGECSYCALLMIQLVPRCQYQPQFECDVRCGVGVSWSQLCLFANSWGWHHSLDASIEFIVRSFGFMPYIQNTRRTFMCKVVWKIKYIDTVGPLVKASTALRSTGYRAWESRDDVVWVMFCVENGRETKQHKTEHGRVKKKGMYNLRFSLIVTTELLVYHWKNIVSHPTYRKIVSTPPFCSPESRVGWISIPSNRRWSNTHTHTHTHGAVRCRPVRRSHHPILPLCWKRPSIRPCSWVIYSIHHDDGWWWWVMMMMMMMIRMIIPTIPTTIIHGRTFLRRPLSQLQPPISAWLWRMYGNGWSPL